MSSSIITFDLSVETFCSSDQNLDKKWLELAQANINEVESNRWEVGERKIWRVPYFLPFRANILAEFKALVNKDPKSAKFLTKNFLLDDNYLLIYLRFIQ